MTLHVSRFALLLIDSMRDDSFSSEKIYVATAETVSGVPIQCEARNKDILFAMDKFQGRLNIVATSRATKSQDE